MKVNQIGIHSILLLLLALLVGGGIAGILIWERVWDNPETATITSTGEINYQGIKMPFSITCSCPKYLIQDRAASLRFTISSETQSTQHRQLPGIPDNSGQEAAPKSDKTGTSSVETFWFWFGDDYTGYLQFPNGDWSEQLTTNAKPFQNVPGNINLTVHQVVNDKLVFHVSLTDPITHYLGDSLGSASFDIQARPQFIEAHTSSILAISFIGLAAFLIFVVDWRIRVVKAKHEKAQRLAAVRQLAADNPDQAKCAWNLARARLEEYIDQNSHEVPWVFWLSVSVTLLGFLVVLIGVYGSFNSTRSLLSSQKAAQPSQTIVQSESAGRTAGTATPEGHIDSSLLATGAGLIIQFLGATFLVIYKSTIKQAGDFVLVLDRINNVGMAMQVLDQIKDETAPELKNQVRAKIITQLLDRGRNSAENSSPSE
jgi:hypothetical protein